MKNAGSLAVKYLWPNKDSGMVNLITRMAVNLAVNILFRRIRKRLLPRIEKLLPRRKASRAGRKGGKAAEELTRKAKNAKRRMIESKPEGKGLKKKGNKVKKLLLAVPVAALLAGAFLLLKKKLVKQ